VIYGIFIRLFVVVSFGYLWNGFLWSLFEQEDTHRKKGREEARSFFPACFFVMFIP